MKRPYYRKPKTSSPKVPQSANNLQALRERMLNVILLGAVIVGGVALIPNLVANLRRGEWGVILVYSLAYVVVLLLAFYKKAPYRYRTVGFLFLFYVLGLTTTLTNGVAGNGRVWFLGLTILSGVLLGLNPGILTLGFSLATYLVIGSLMVGNVIRTPRAASLPSASVYVDWLSTAMVYVLIAVVIIIAIYVVIRDLNASIEKERGFLEEFGRDREELDRRTNELDRRLIQMRTAAEISRSIGMVMESSALLRQVVNVVRDRFDLYYVGVFLLDERDEYAELKAGTGEAGLIMLADGHKLPVGGASMIGWSIAHRQPRIALDIGEEAVIFTNPLLPMTRSEMALPLLRGDHIFGAMTVQSSKPRAFDEDDVTVLQGIADSIAIALQNARLFQQEKENLEEIRALNRQYISDAWEKIALDAEINSFSYSNDLMNESDNGIETVSVPIALREQVIGQVSLEFPPGDLSAEDRVFIEQVTNQAALAIENVRLLEETQRRANRERLVTEIVKKARSSSDVDTILRTTLGELGRSMQAAEGMIRLEEPEKSAIPQHNGSDL